MSLLMVLNPAVGAILPRKKLCRGYVGFDTAASAIIRGLRPVKGRRKDTFANHSGPYMTEVC